MNDIENKVLETEPAANEAAKTIDENDFMASIEASMRRIHTGQTVTGTVVQPFNSTAARAVHTRPIAVALMSIAGLLAFQVAQVEHPLRLSGEAFKGVGLYQLDGEMNAGDR